MRKMTNPNKLVCLFFVLLLLSSCRERPRPATARLMPEGFEYMYLGRDIDSTLLNMEGLRLDSETNLYYIDEENPNNSFIEIMLFSSGPVRYIRFIGRGEPENIIGFLAGCVEKWGKDFERRITIVKEIDSLFYRPMLYWKKEDAKIFVSYTHPSTIGQRQDWNNRMYFTVEFYTPNTIRFYRLTGKIIPVRKELEIYFDQIDNIDSLFKNYSGPIFK
jgi:hypothetical protein